METKSGYVTIIGKPNVGKSTLMNALLGEKLSITTNKPQTTRKRILGILSEENYQIIFLDTPGILKPDYLLQEKMMDYVHQSVKDADILLFLLDINDDPLGKRTLENEIIQKILSVRNKKKVLVINKIDISDQKHVQDLMDAVEKTKLFESIIPMSASENYNVEAVLNYILENLPVHPKFFPDNPLSDENERFFVTEIIREKILELYHDEVPYSCEVLIEEFKEREGRKDFISVAIVAEKETQKPIIIGKGGDAIKRLGETSRKAIEEFLQRPVYLEMRVKVRDKWRSNPNMLKSFGYNAGEE